MEGTSHAGKLTIDELLARRGFITAPRLKGKQITDEVNFVGLMIDAIRQKSERNLNDEAKVPMKRQEVL